MIIYKCYFCYNNMKIKWKTNRKYILNFVGSKKSIRHTTNNTIFIYPIFAYIDNITRYIKYIFRNDIYYVVSHMPRICLIMKP